MNEHEHGVLRMRMASAFREVENDALERAAGMALENDAIAQAIRALKHAV